MDSKRTFVTRLHAISARPGMYVGGCSIDAVLTYLDGYDAAAFDAGIRPSPLEGWLSWVQLRFLICHSAWGPARILLHTMGSDREAIGALPRLYAEFVAARDSVGPDGLEAALGPAIANARGTDWYEPPSSPTLPASYPDRWYHDPPVGE